MKMQNLYADLSAMVRAYGAATDTVSTAEELLASPVNFHGDNCAFYSAARSILFAVVVEEDKRKAGKMSVPALKRIASKAARDDFHGIFVENGRFCATDGYRGVRLFNDVDSIPHVEVSPVLGKCIGNPADYSLPVTLPSMAELQTTIKEQGKGKALFCIDGLVLVNAEYLRDMIQVLPDARAYVNPKKGATGIVYFVSEYGDGILLPCRPHGQWEIAIATRWEEIGQTLDASTRSTMERENEKCRAEEARRAEERRARLEEAASNPVSMVL